MDYRKDPKMTVLLALAVGAALALAGCKLPEIDIATIDFASLADGSYGGSYKADMGSATVKVGVSGGRVTGIELVAFDSSPIGEPAKAMPLLRALKLAMVEAMRSFFSLSKT